LRVPAGRAIITCHDLDTFRSLLEPALEPRSWWFKLMMRHVLSGFRRAACITCDTAAVRDEIVSRGVAPSDRVVVVPIGVAEQFSAISDPAADREIAGLIPTPPGALEILHVGSTVPRKRIDLVLRAVAEVRRHFPNVHLVRIGGALTADQDRLARELGLDACLWSLPSLDDRHLAAIYRRAAIVLLPSDREGFGLPLVEAMACGTLVVASDLPVLREVGGETPCYCTPGEASSYARGIADLLREREERPDRWIVRRNRGVAWARQFTWTQFAARLADIYSEVARTSWAPRSKESAACPA
jgi:glycosyltransferase involved in cell wall biosynthesis